MANHDSKRNSSVRVVLYLRMSSAGQEQSIPAQRAELEAYAKKHGYVIVAEYVDEAISGDDTERRAGFLRMREDAQRGEFDVVLSWDQDRFGRFDQLDAGYWIYPFRQAGVRLETVAQGQIDWENLTGQLIYSVNQMGKAQFLRDLSRNTARGLLASAREGRAGTGGPSPYGYRSKDGVVSVIPDEAKVIRRIFREYLKSEGSLRGIAASLNRRKTPPPRGKVWRMSSVRAILQRRKYTGTFMYGQQNAGKYYSFRDGEVIPRRKSDKAIVSEPIVHENHFEAIVDQKTFDRVQAKLESRKGKTARRQARQYLLTGLVWCGDCDGTMGGFVQSAIPSYRCRTYHQTGATVCHRNTIKEAPLVDVIARKVRDLYLSDAALTRLRRAMEKAQEQSRPRPGDLSRLRREIDSLDQKIDRGAERVLEAPADLLPTIYRKLEETRSERDRLKAELASLTSRESRSNGRGDKVIDRAIEALRDLGDALSKASPKDTKELLSQIVTRIELHFEDGTTGRQKRAFTHGDIYVRPDVGGNQDIQPGGQVTHMNKIRPILERSSGRRESPRCQWTPVSEQATGIGARL